MRPWLGQRSSQTLKMWWTSSQHFLSISSGKALWVFKKTFKSPTLSSKFKSSIKNPNNTEMTHTEWTLIQFLYLYYITSKAESKNVILSAIIWDNHNRTHRDKQVCVLVFQHVEIWQVLLVYKSYSHPSDLWVIGKPGAQVKCLQLCGIVLLYTANIN